MLAFLGVVMVFEFKAEIISIRDYFSSHKLNSRLFQIEIPENVKFNFQAGQFVMISSDNVRLPNNELKWGAFSIASSRFELPFIELIVRIKETPGLTNYLGFNTKIGDKINVRGPLGSFTLNKEDKERVFIATGTGIAPMIAYLKEMQKTSFIPTKLFFGCTDTNTIFFEEFLTELKERQPNFEWHQIISCNDPAFPGRKGFVQDCLKEYSFPEDKTAIGCYVCGNPAMIADVISLLKSMGFTRIFTEQY